MAHVSSISQRVLALTGGVDSFEVPAASLRELMRALEQRYPGLADLIDQRMAIAIDGEIHQDTLDEPLTPQAEVVLIPRIGGG